MFVAVTLARQAMPTFAPIGPHTIPGHGIIRNAKHGSAKDVVQNIPSGMDATTIITINAEKLLFLGIGF